MGKKKMKKKKYIYIYTEEDARSESQTSGRERDAPITRARLDSYRVHERFTFTRRTAEDRDGRTDGWTDGNADGTRVFRSWEIV